MFASLSGGLAALCHRRNEDGNVLQMR